MSVTTNAFLPLPLKYNYSYRYVLFNNRTDEISSVFYKHFDNFVFFFYCLVQIINCRSTRIFSVYPRLADNQLNCVCKILSRVAVRSRVPIKRVVVFIIYFIAHPCIYVYVYIYYLLTNRKPSLVSPRFIP